MLIAGSTSFPGPEAPNRAPPSPTNPPNGYSREKLTIVRQQRSASQAEATDLLAFERPTAPQSQPSAPSRFTISVVPKPQPAPVEVVTPPEPPLPAKKSRFSIARIPRVPSPDADPAAEPPGASADPMPAERPGFDPLIDIF
jgi:hypothetical protein